MDAMSDSPIFAASTLVAARLAGLFIAAPFFRSALLHWRLKLGLLALLSICVLVSPAVTASMFERSPELLERMSRPLDGWLLLASEALLGVVIGWSGLVVLALVRTAAQIIAQQGGLAAATIADPQGAESDTPLPFFYETFTVFLLLALDLHHTLIRALVGTYETVPPGTVTASSLPALLTRLALDVGPDLLAGTLLLALPVCLALGIVSLAQGVLGRALPEAELFTLGLPVRAFASLLVIVVGLPASAGYLRGLLSGALGNGGEVLKGFSG